jgi:hypothetical protein
MLDSISWGSYCTVLGISLVLYYGWLLWHYRHALVVRAAPVPALLPVLEDELHPFAEALRHELTAYLDQLAHRSPAKNELLFGIHKIIQHYPLLPGTVYQPALSQWIGFIVKDQCAIHLSEEEIRQVWLV